MKRSVIVLPVAPALFVAGLADPGKTSGSLVLLLAIGLAVVL